MSYPFGKNWKLNRWDSESSTMVALGILDPSTLRVGAEARTFKMPVGGSRTLGVLKAQEVTVPLRFSLALQRFDYITDYCMPEEEAAISSHVLRGTDGIKKFEWTGCKVNSCELSIRRGEPVKAAIEIFASDINDAATFAEEFVEFSEDPILWSDLQSLKIAGNTVTDWREIVVRVNNNVRNEFLGPALKPSIIYEEQAEYSGHILLAGSCSQLGNIKNGSKISIEFTLQDHQATPTTKTWKFDGCIVTVNRAEPPGLGLVIERLEFEAKTLGYS